MDLHVGRCIIFHRLLIVSVALCAAAFPQPALSVDCHRCDATGDGIIDSADLEVFIGCITGPSVGPPTTACTFADLDQDNDVDQDDFGLFQACLGLNLEPGEVFISEIMAEDNRVLTDDNGEYPDWIELYNSGSSAVNLQGWFLTDDPENLRKWRFPSTPLAALEHKVVFASGEDRVGPNGELHTSFALDAGGEYLALVKPDGMVVAAEFAPVYPRQKTGVSYGLRAERLPGTMQLIAPGAACRYLVPTSDLGLSWTALDYPAESAWTSAHTGIGYDRNNPARYDSLLAPDGDVEALLYGQSKFTIYIRIPFTFSTVGPVSKLTLKMKYDDAFAVYLNGNYLLKSERAAETPAWNSKAKSPARDQDPNVYEEFDLTPHVGLLRTGVNVLAIHGMNYSSNSADLSSDLLFLPELWIQGAAEGVYRRDEPRYFSPPSPGDLNATGYAGFVADTQFSVDRGLYEAPVQVEITTETPDAIIRYSTDGRTLTETTGHVYTGPLSINATTTLRAAAFKADYLPTNTDTQTYLFPSSIINQPALPPGFPDHWGNDPTLAIAGANDTWVPADYQLDPRVTTATEYSDRLVDALKSIPSVSLVMNTDYWFDPIVGIYSNKLDEGLAWERPVSAELIYPDGRPGFQVDCGIRIQGGTSTANNSSTLWKCMKQSMRLLFKDQYGTSKLHFPLYADSPVEEFNNLILDAHMNNSWVHSTDAEQRRRGDYARDAWMASLQTAMGAVGTHNIFVHVYINGLYWGLYELHEKPDESFCADYFGGDRSDYDVIKHNLETANIVNGDQVAYRAMMELAKTANYDAVYLQLQEQYLDIDAFIDYMLLNFYAGNQDWAHQNWYAARSRQPGGRFRFISWDAEHVIEDGGTDWNYNNLTKNDYNLDSGGNLAGPTHLHQLLRVHPEYRLRFADHVHRHLFNGGMLSVQGDKVWTPDYPERNRPADYYRQRSRTIESAVIMESARWGDVARPAQPYTRDLEWITEQNRLINTYFPKRWDFVLAALQNQGLYPLLAAPEFSQFGGAYASGFRLTMTAPGEIWFTLNGTDPRLPGGDPNGDAIIYGGPVSLTGTVRVKARTLSGATWSALTEALFAPATPPTIRVTEVMYHPPAGGTFDQDEYEFIELQNIGTTAIQLEGLTLSAGIEFTFPRRTLAAGAYLVVVENQAAFTERYGSTPVVAGQYTGGLKNSNDTLRLADALGQVILEFTYQDSWYPATDGLGYSLCIRDVYADPQTWSEAGQWQASAALLGSPGRTDP